MEDGVEAFVRGCYLFVGGIFVFVVRVFLVQTAEFVAQGEVRVYEGGMARFWVGRDVVCWGWEEVEEMLQAGIIGLISILHR